MGHLILSEFPKQIIILDFDDNPNDLVTSYCFCSKCLYTCLEIGAQSHKAFLRIYFHNSKFLRGKEDKSNTSVKFEMCKRQYPYSSDTHTRVKQGSGPALPHKHTSVPYTAICI